MQEKIEKLNHFLWSDVVASRSQFHKAGVYLLRFMFVLYQHLFRGQLTLRAMSLVYTTLLSLVPLLAVSFSVLKGFGVHNQVEPFLLSILSPIGPKSVELTENIIMFVENVKVGVLGSLGLLFLLYTVVSLTQKVESSFNYVWRVDKMRNLAERFANYLSVILIGPVFVFVAIGVTATAMNNDMVQYLIGMEPLGKLIVAGGRLIPYLLVIGVFTFLYRFLPNTDVHFVPALIGGIVAGITWETSGWLFASFVANSSKYTAIYSGFAIVIVLMIWLYLSWLVLLLGSQVAFYIQYPQYIQRASVKFTLSNRLRERLALQTMVLVARRYVKGGDPLTAEQLVNYLSLPEPAIHHLLDELVASGFLAQTGQDHSAYLPNRDIDSIRIADLYQQVREVGENKNMSWDELPDSNAVEEVVSGIQTAINSSLQEMTLRDLVNGNDSSERVTG